MDGRELTPLAMALHGLRCIALDANTVIDWHGEQRLCDAALCKELAEAFLYIVERASEPRDGDAP